MTMDHQKGSSKVSIDQDNPTRYFGAKMPYRQANAAAFQSSSFEQNTTFTTTCKYYDIEMFLDFLCLVEFGLQGIEVKFGLLVRPHSHCDRTFTFSEID